MNPNTTVGILGGGQLAQMLLEAAMRLGLEPIVLAERSNDPAARACPRAIFGSMTDAAVLRRFLTQASLVIFENEFVDTELLERVADGGTRFLPGLSAIAHLQDKLNQKRLLDELEIESAHYAAFEGANLKSWVSDVTEEFSGQVVFKWAKFGYDGKGTLISPGSPAEALSFCETALKRGVRVFAEKKVKFKRELSLVSSYSINGEMACYPLVVSQQHSGICKLVSGPATSLGVSPRLQSKAEGFARAIAEKIQLHGTFAIELFETEDGALAVNELAPRVHNTGHFSQDAAVTSQFENHWRAVLGYPLGSTRTAEAFAMLNFLGPEGATGSCELPRPSSRSSLHWYGKAEVRFGRKMGHLNGQAETVGELGGLVEELKAADRRWLDGVLGKT